MKFLRQLAMTASLACAATSASAQYNPYAAPATLPVPANPPRQFSYPTPPGVPANELHEPHGLHAVPPNAAPAGQDPYADWMGDCNGCAPCCTERAPCWYVSVIGLYMTRNKPDPYQMSFDTTNPVGELILNHDTLGDWEPGGEIRFGVYVGCRTAVEFSYWTLNNFDQQKLAFDPPGVGSLNTPFDFRSLEFGAGNPVTDWYDNAEAHRVTRRDEIHNFELNVIRHGLVCSPCSPLQVSGLVGVRYFRFAEDFQFASADDNPVFGADPATEAYYDIDVQNNLYGVQLGGQATFNLTKRWSVYAAPRFGVFINDMDQSSRIYTGTGITAMEIHSDRQIISVLGQLDVGLNYQFACGWSAQAGYRIIGISGIALSDRQIPYLQDDLFGISDIDHASNLVLHGITAGVEYRY
jgi:hypothetical protein